MSTKVMSLIRDLNFWSRLKIIDRYILKELIGPYIFGMLGFMVVISIDPMIYAMKNIINSSERGVEAMAVLKWFCYSLATDMIFTFPMAMLLATLIVFGRLSKDSELTALKAGGFSFTRETHEIKLGPIELSVKEKQAVNIPVWAGVGAIVIGAGLLLIGGKKG